MHVSKPANGPNAWETQVVRSQNGKETQAVHPVRTSPGSILDYLIESVLTRSNPGSSDVLQPLEHYEGTLAACMLFCTSVALHIYLKIKGIHTADVGASPYFVKKSCLHALTALKAKMRNLSGTSCQRLKWYILSRHLGDSSGTSCQNA